MMDSYSIKIDVADPTWLIKENSELEALAGKE
jgi:exoribonuclease II